MANIVIICVGKLDKAHWKIAAQDYLKRINYETKIDMQFINDANTNNIANNIKEESNKIRALLNKHASYQAYLLDLTGDLISSEDIAKIIVTNQNFYQGKLLFIIGGSNGVTSDLKNDHKIKKIALGKITFPHQLCQVILLEQIYRAYQIINNKPYHK